MWERDENGNKNKRMDGKKFWKESAFNGTRLRKLGLGN